MQMRDIVADAKAVAYCGLYCGACGAYRKETCPGCHENKKASWCKIRTCCAEHGYSSCADCTIYGDPNDCELFNNFMSKMFAVVFRSDRAACIAQIKTVGIDGHAKAMAASGHQSMKKR
jgi:hypothetical protein